MFNVRIKSFWSISKNLPCCFGRETKEDIMYANKAAISRIFGISPPTVYKRVEEIEGEIGKRYNQYAILENLVSIEVFADYQKYRKWLKNKNLRKNIPDFTMAEAREYLVEEGLLHVVCKEANISH